MTQSFDRTLICGSIAYDEIMDFPGKFIDHIDKTKLHQINVSFVVDRLDRQFGGIATNIAYNVRLVSGKRIGIISALGKDGRPFLDFFKKNDIDSDALIVDNAVYTATGKVITDQSDNQIWGYFYGPLQKAELIEITGNKKNTILYILSPTHKQAFLKHQRDLIRHKCSYIYDPGMALSWIHQSDLTRGVEHCAVLVGNDYEMAQIYKKIDVSKQALLKRDIIIITTLGGEGVLYEKGGEKIRVPAYQKTKVVDPTGAGDAWRGGFIGGILEHKDIKECLMQANALASFAVERYGTVNHQPTKKQLDRRIQYLLDNK